MQADSLAREWTLLQSQCASYERGSLVIKLVATVVVGLSLLMPFGAQWSLCVVVGILWLQDAIWKTFQSRIEVRILRLETALAAESSSQPCAAYQLHTEFRASRHAGGTLIQYARQAIRPTVAYPYVALVALLLATRLVPVWV